MAHQSDTVEVYPGIAVNAGVMHGVPVISGTRVPARLIVGQLAAGDSIEALMEAYALSREQVQAALGYAAERLGAESTYALPIA